MITPNYRRFILSNIFLDNYKGKQPKWGPLGYVTYKSRYARLKDDGKTEEFWETLKRVVEGVFNTQKKHCSNLGLEWDNAKAQKTAQEMYDAMWNFKFLPPGRGLWMAGTDYVENRTSMSIFNCSYVSTEDLDRRGARPFAFIMDGLMLGVGMGFDTKGEKSITIKEPAFSDSTHIISDSREGWVESLEILLNGYFSGSKVPVFDYSALRGKGEPLKGFGGVSSGPQPLITLHEEIKDLLEPKIGDFITSAEIVDIENLISKCVIAGNIRRCLPKGTLLQTTAGFKKIEDCVVGDTVIHEKGTDKISNVFYQGKQPVYKIHTQTGELLATAKHRFAVMDSLSTYVWKTVDSLQKGDRLVFVDTVLKGAVTKFPDFTYIKPEKSTTCIDINIPKIDEDMAWFIGAFHGNGYVYKNLQNKGGAGHISLAFHPDHKESINKAKNIIKKFGIVPKEVDKKYNGATNIVASSRQLSLFFFDNIKKPNTVINIPDFISGGTETVKAAYLAGVLDTDGSAGTKPIIACTSIYKEFLEELQALYTSLGIITRLRLARPEKGNWKPLYVLAIIGEDALQKTEKKLGKFLSKNLIEKKQTNFGYGYPHTFVKGLGIPIDYNSKQTTHDRVITYNIDTKNMIPVEVLEIFPDFTTEETYDIQVENSNRFILGNGILSHNSAAIALGRKDDQIFLELKHDQEKLVSHRYASNNSILADVGMDYSIPAENTVKQGEPGYIWLDNMRTKGRFKDKNASFDNVGGVNPCLSGDTRLLTNEGYIPIGNLEDTSVTLIDNKGNQATGKVWKTGTRDTVFVTLSTGAKIQCTPDHIFMTKDGRSVRALFLEGETLSTYDGTNCKEKYIMVTSVYPAGKTEVYDFSIDTEGHWGICEDVVVHNCSEQQLESFEACNLTELFPVNHDSFEEYKRTIKLAYLYAKTITLMNTHWPETNAIMLKNRRIGLSQTGIQQARIKHGTRELLNWCDEGYKYVQKLDEKYSDWLCIPRSKRTTTVKPSGTVSLLPGVTPGIHYDESEYYIRRIRFEDISPLLPAIEKAGYKIEQDIYNKTSKVVEFPVKADFFERSKYEVSMWEQLEFAAKYQHYWSDNAVSITVTFKPEEAKDIKNALELYEDRLKVVSFLPLGDHGYKQAPYEAITEEQYKEMTKGLKKLNFKNITSQAQGEKFCDGDQCEV